MQSKEAGTPGVGHGEIEAQPVSVSASAQGVQPARGEDLSQAVPELQAPFRVSYVGKISVLWALTYLSLGYVLHARFPFERTAETA